MKLSTKVRYGLRGLVELALADPDKPVPLKVLAENQDIPNKYLEQMISSLKIAGLVASVRGAEGGYRLAKPPSSITAWDVYQVLDVSAVPVECVDGSCGKNRKDVCVCQEMWQELSEAIFNVLQSWTLEKLATREVEMRQTAKKTWQEG